MDWDMPWYSAQDALDVLLLLFIGIHNAWDSATFTALVLPSAEDTGQD